MTDRKDYLPLSLLALMILWFGGEMVWDDKVPFFRDLAFYFYPMRFSLAASFHAGELPLWERHAAMGFPLLADFQSGVFYPPHLLFGILPFFTGLRAVFLIHYLVAAAGAYLLCRHWGYAPAIALIGAVLFTLGGATVSLTNLLNHFQTAVWLPWVLLFGERCFRAQSWNGFLALVAVLLLQFLAGSPEIYGMSAALLFLDGFRLKTEGPAVSRKKIFLFFTAAHAAVAALAMAQILPTVELIRESRARWSVGLTDAAAWSLRPLELINLFFPDKQVNLDVTPPLVDFFSPKVPFLVSYYLGALAALGLACWCWYAPRREKLVLSLLVIVTLLLAAGDGTPVYSALLRHLSFFALFRFPEKFFFVTNALLLFVVLKGVYDLLNPAREDKAPVWFAGAMVLVFGLFYAWFRLDTWPLTQFIAWVRGNGLTHFTLEISTQVLARLEIQIALTFGLFVLVAGKKFGVLRQSLFTTLVVVFVLVDLGSVHRPLQFLTKPDFVTKNSAVLSMSPREPARLFYAPAAASLHPNEFFLSKEVDYSRFNTLVFDNIMPDTGIFYGFDYMQELDALGRWPYTAFLQFTYKLPPEPLYRLLGALNVKYVVRFFPQQAEGLKLERHFPQYPSWLYRIERVIPRSYVVNLSIEERDPWKILERLSSENFSPLREVLLDQRLEVTAKKDFHGEAKIEEYRNQTVTIHASLNGAGILVLADSFYPGWRAYVDGKEEKIFRANLFFRGVKLDAGEHRVEFRYEPRSFRVGLTISLATLLILIAVSVVIFLKRKKTPAET